ncbi:MAG: hypothetical protein QOC89_6112 [Paraburkholderia sp.]|nr:hypothetical protein [Paraburkholderia sp.]
MFGSKPIRRLLILCGHCDSYCADDAPLPVAPGVVVMAGSLVAGDDAPALASLARFAASLVPGVPLRPAELLMTPLLPELMVSLLELSTFLQPVATVTSPDMTAINSIFLTVGFMTDLQRVLGKSAPVPRSSKKRVRPFGNPAARRDSPRPVTACKAGSLNGVRAG